jgi:tetratricopeptide (TPR) repeat protein
VLKKALALDPNDSRFYINLGKVYAEKYEYEEALKYFKKAIALQPDAEPYYEIGQINRIKRNYPEAIKWYKEAIIVNPLYAARTVPRILAIFDEEKNYDGALKVFNELVAINPTLANSLRLFQERKEINLDVEKWITDDLVKIINLCKERGIAVILMDYPGGLRIKAGINSHIIQRLAEEKSLPFIDNYSVFNHLPNKADYFVPDGHCNAKGYGIIARNAFNIVIRQLSVPHEKL